MATLVVYQSKLASETEVGKMEKGGQSRTVGVEGVGHGTTKS